MNKDEKTRLIGIVIVSIVLLIFGYLIYKNFFTYDSFHECVGERTLKPGMSDKQVAVQQRYCAEYFGKI